MAALFAIAASAALCAGLIVLLRPVLVRYALARPNARSSHRAPTPQGGGIAVIAATLLVGGAVAAAAGAAPPASSGLIALATATVILAAVGAVDDVRPLSPAARLALQAFAVWMVVMEASEGGRIFSDAVPLWAEQTLAVLAGVWFVNLVNFMDGLDWMTVAEIVPITAALALLGQVDVLPFEAAAMAAALLGAMLAFAWFNKPVARLFLGDVGSLPIGLLVAWMLYHLASAGALAAAVLLPLYYVADATITLLRRLARGEKVWQAHRTHFYQRATDNGLSVIGVVGRVFGLNLGLAGLAAVTVAWPGLPVQLAALAAGCALVGLVLARFSQSRREAIA